MVLPVADLILKGTRILGPFVLATAYSLNRHERHPRAAVRALSGVVRARTAAIQSDAD